MVTKAEAMKAWEDVNNIIDMLDYQGALSDEEVNILEVAMTTILKFINRKET